MNKIKPATDPTPYHASAWITVHMCELMYKELEIAWPVSGDETTRVRAYLEP